MFLDRDGVINEMVYNLEFGVVDSIAKQDDFVIKPGIGRVVREINKMNYLAIVISNQPGIAKGKYSEKILEEITEKMHQELAKEDARLDAVYYCLHHPDAIMPEYKISCKCRKPKPGLIQQTARVWDIDLNRSFFIGDGITDILAGKSAGTKTILHNSRKLYVLDALSKHNIFPDYFAERILDVIAIIKGHADDLH